MSKKNKDEWHVENPDIQPVDGADISQFPENAFIRYQVIAMGKYTKVNYRFILYDDARFFLTETQSSDLPSPQRFDQPYPEKPIKILNDEEMKNLEKTIKNESFFNLCDGYSPPGRVFEGAMNIMEIRLGGSYKRVIVDRCDCNAVDKILNKIWEIVYKK